MLPTLQLAPGTVPALAEAPGTRARPATPAADAAPGDIWFRVLVTAAIYAVPLLVALRPVGDPIYDPDIWWHLRAGQWVVEHGGVPANDPFSLPGLGKPWVAYSWLYEVVVYGLYQGLGLAGVVVYRALLTLAVAAAVHRLVCRGGPRFVVGAALTGLALLPLAMLFSERPWLLTVLFGTLTLHAVLDLREERRSWLPWLLPLVFTLWANLHIQFVYGLLLLGLACVAPWLDRLLGMGAGNTGAAVAGSAAWRKLVSLTAVCALATLANPYHARVYQVVVEYATQPGPFRFVNELRAPEFREPCDWALLAFVGAAAFALGRRRGLSFFDVLLLAGSAALAFRARRDLWVAVLASLVILAAPARAAAGPAEPFAWTARRRAALVGLLAGLAVLLAWVRDLSPANLERKAAGVFPVEAARHVAEHGYAGPLFNDFNWGGYLIWALPGLPVALDGRTNLHGDERILRVGNTWAGGRGWRENPDLAAAGVVVSAADSPLASLLACDGRFALAHEDPVAKVFVARRPPRP
jgi:hypothetical protein